MALVKAVLEGKLPASAIFRDRLATCAGCLACEAACSSGVPVTEIIAAAKEQAIAESGTGIISRIISEVMTHPGAFRAGAWLAPFMLHYKKGPETRSTLSVRRSKKGGAGRPEKKGRVAFFPGCAVENLQPDIGKATIGVLRAIGYDVVVPEGLKCCGRPLFSLGDRKTAAELAAHNAGRLLAAGADAIVTSCASCGLTFKKEYPKLLRPGVTVPAVLDIHEFLSNRLADIRLTPVHRSVTVHDPCHLGRGQGLSQVVRELLRSVPGLTLVEMKDADRCCGFGGVMRITHRELSDGIAEGKARNIIATKTGAVVTGCPGCRMQIVNALQQQGSSVEVLHTVQLLEEAIAIAE